MDQFQFNSKYDVPELAGYSLDGKTFYVDKHMPRFMDYKDSKVDVYKYLLIHETVEYTLRTKLGFSYDHAHDLASICEWFQLKKDRVDYATYNSFCQKYIEMTESEAKRNIPPDLENPWTGREYRQVDLKLKYAKSAVKSMWKYLR